MLVLVGMVYKVEEFTNGELSPDLAKELVTNLLVSEAPEIDSLETSGIQPLKVWASAEPHVGARDAEINYLNIKAQNDPEFGFTVTGKRIQNEMLEKAQAELIQKVKDEFDAADCTDDNPGGDAQTIPKVDGTSDNG